NGRHGRTVGRTHGRTGRDRVGLRINRQAAQYDHHDETEAFHGLRFVFASFSIQVRTLLEMVRKELVCRHKKPSPSTRKVPSTFCNCNGPAELAVAPCVS